MGPTNAMLTLPNIISTSLELSVSSDNAQGNSSTGHIFSLQAAEREHFIPSRIDANIESKLQDKHFQYYT